MEQIGQILNKDYLLLQDSDLSSTNINERLLMHAQYLRICNFTEFRLLIPHNTSESILANLNNFISKQNIPGALRYYIPVDNRSKFDEEVIMNPELSFKDWVAVLPSEDFRYENFAKKIWNLSMGGKAIIVLLPERVEQWRKKTTHFKRLHLKGANMAFSGSSLFKMGFFHKSNLIELHKSRIIHMWITPQIYDVNSALFKKDMAIKLATITSIKTPPNEL